MKIEKWETLSSKKCCENQWISVRQDRVKLPSKDILESYIVISYCGAVGVLAINNNEILLVNQYRYPLNLVTLEIPAGALLSKDEASIKETAKAELLEEAGYVAKSIEIFHKFHPSPGSSDEVIHLVIAKDLEKSSNPLEKDMAFEAKWYKIDDVMNFIETGIITHSPTIIGVLLGLRKGLFDNF